MYNGRVRGSPWSRKRAISAESTPLGRSTDPDGVKYAFDAGNWSLDQPRVRKGSLKNGFSTVSLARPSPKQRQFYATLALGNSTMTIQSSVQIGNVIRNAVVFNVKNWLGGTMNSDSLIQSVQDFFAVLEQRKIDYVLVGGIAILHYVEGRNTQDLDLLMALSSLEKLPELKVSDQDSNFVRANYNELQIDVLLTQNPLFKKVHKEYSKVQRFLDRDIPWRQWKVYYC
jgi:hypothetical protein